jgi:cytochrome c55X
MRTATLLAIALAATGFLGSAYPADGGDGTRADPPASARQAELIRMVRHDCGSCHGLTLAGGLGPALDAQALRDKPADYLEAMILRGRPGTAMPGWGGLLSEQDARWIAQALKEGFPDAR